MTDDGQALLRAIVADPEDDTPRLIYADWLDERGPSDRAAFIRAHIEAVRSEPYSPKARAARDRAEHLFEWNKTQWTEHVRALLDQAGFVRGFIGKAEVDAARFADNAPPLFDAEPVQSVRLTRSGPFGWAALKGVFDVPQLARVRELEFAPLAPLAGLAGLADDEYAALAACPHLSGLTDLTLRGNPVPPRWLADLLSGRAMPNLTGLNLADIPNLGPGLTAAAEGCPHRRFKKLDVSGVVFRSGELQRFLTSPCLSRLESLVLRPPPGTDRGPLTHLDMGWVLPWATLRKVDLGGQGLGAEAVREFAEIPDGAGLRWLGLSNNRLTAAGARALAESPYLNLYHLDVRDNDLSPADVAALRARYPDAKIEA